MSLEHQGIRTEKGEYNRWVKWQNAIITNALTTLENALDVVKSETDKWKATLKEKANEIIDVIDNVVKRKGVLSVPVVNAKYIAKIGHRNELQNPDNVKRIAEAKKWKTFEQVKDDYARDGADFDRKEVDINKQFVRLQHLNKLMQAYKDFKPVMEVHSEYDKLNGLAKIKYKKEYSYELEQYPELREKYEELVGENKRFRPNEWQSEIEQIEHSIDEYKHHASGRAFILATAEVLFHNRKELERLRENEEREKNRQKESVKKVNRGID